MKHLWTTQTPNLKQTPIIPDKTVGYEYNSQGYRDDEFKWLNPNGQEPYSIAIGCSHTWGMGLLKDEVWVGHFKKIFQYPHKIWNMGMPSASNDKIYRILHNVVGYKKRKPESVIVQITHPERAEWIYSDNGTTISHDWVPSGGYDEDQIHLRNYYKITTDGYHFQKTIELMTAMKTLLDTYSIPHMFWWTQNYFNCSMVELAKEYKFNLCSTTMSQVGNDLARDGQHFGAKSHLEIYKRLYDYTFECNILKQDGEKILPSRKD